MYAFALDTYEKTVLKSSMLKGLINKFKNLSIPLYKIVVFSFVIIHYVIFFDISIFLPKTKGCKKITI